MSQSYLHRVNKADVTKLVSRLRIPVQEHVKHLKNPQGLEGRLEKLRTTVTALFKYERIELNYSRADEARGYAERLISEAIRHGPYCRDTMEMANWWLVEKQLVPKLFEVLVPRFEHLQTAYTRLYRAPEWTWSDGYHPEADRHQYHHKSINTVDGFARVVHYKKAVLELHGHPYPPLYTNSTQNPSLLHNVLLAAAKADRKKSNRSSSSSALESEGAMQTNLSQDGAESEVIHQQEQEIEAENKVQSKEDNIKPTSK